MLRLIAFLVVAAVLAVVAVWLANHPGSVVIDWQGRTLQTSVGILVLAFLVVAVAFVVLFEIVRGLRALPARWLEGREEVAHLKFRQMLRSRETELLGLRGLLAQAMRAGDREEALSLARRAYRRSPSTPWVLSTLFDLLAHAGRWEEALNLTAETVTQRVLSPDEARRHRVVLHHMVARTFRAENRPQEALAQARRGVR